MREPRPSLPIVLGIAALVVVALLNTAQVRERAEEAIGRGMPPREAELARGFVLGQDDEIDDRTVEDFRRSGLAHLLAVSGQNVMLLALLASPILAAFGIPLRTRLVWILGLIAIYVPLAGAGPSIQRAGVMGALGVLATLAGRRASRFYALAVAAVVTLAIDPGIAADIGWQLSFAAVVGILLLAAPLREAIAERIGSGTWRGALGEGAAVTIAATLATAPLIAFHFEAVSTTTLAANLLALPAVAPAMWLGMLVAAAGQVPAFPVELLNSLNAFLLAYIDQIAAWCGRPSWAYLEGIHLGPGGVAVAYAAIAATVVGALRLARHHRLASLKRSSPQTRPRCNVLSPYTGDKTLHHRGAAVVVCVATCVAVGLGWASAGDSAATEPVVGLRVTMLDVGQGDAILLQPARAPAVLVDGGPPGEDLVGKLRDAGVGSLGAAIVTHDQSDHAGGIEELLEAMPVGRLVYGRLDRAFIAEASGAGAAPLRVAAGDVLQAGALRLKVLSPPRESLTGPLGGADPNAQALVILARWRDFSMLLSADAETEAAPVDPGPIDVLKVAHHGSDDAGLGALLDRTAPKLAVISVGDGNHYGHPTPSTLATLSGQGVETFRTDRDGSIELDMSGAAIHVSTED
ncbi:MAG TPA: ComEC/Rec2 family competence protein [Solirubrobacterales bacterium]|nr:ComEC/Rec2 family competence protein [Solirubrobacterales bacterium]